MGGLVMKRLIVIMSSILLIIILLLLGPYNVVHYFTATNKVTTILADENVRLKMLGDDSEITSVSFLGSNIYRVETKESTHLMEIKTDKTTHTIDVFEHKQHIKHFEY
jgi:hypothetical protein